VTFLVDNQLPAALTRWLAAQGHAAQHVVDLGLARATDSEVWRRASELEAVLVTKDADFRDRRLIASGPQVVWVRFGNCRNQTLIDAFARLLPRLIIELESGSPLVEVR
jgi:predicted nuclease of predicted toxin-antitoxin system